MGYIRHTTYNIYNIHNTNENVDENSKTSKQVRDQMHDLYHACVPFSQLSTFLMPKYTQVDTPQVVSGRMYNVDCTVYTVHCMYSVAIVYTMHVHEYLNAVYRLQTVYYY